MTSVRARPGEIHSLFSEPVFRGWAKPGPNPLADQRDAPETAAGETLDALSGYYRIFQLENGHRFSTDDILTAWYGTSWCPRAARVLELGSGLGSAGMVAAWRLPGAHFVTVEAQPESIRLARKSVRYNRLESRYEIREGDFRDPQVIAVTETFDLILGTPPYFPLGAGVKGNHPQKIACRFETRGNVLDYCRVARERLAPGGVFACVFPYAQRERVLQAARESDLAIVRQRPVQFREPEPADIELYAMARNVDLPLEFLGKTWTEPPLVIRTATGEIHPEYSAVKLAIGFPP